MAELYLPRSITTKTKEAASILLELVQTKLHAALKESLDVPFTIKELEHALGKANNPSAPGLDSITYVSIAIMGKPFLDALASLGNLLLQGHSLPKGEPTYQGILTPKKGSPADPKNYRLLSIASAPFCSLGKAMANRLQGVATKIINASQVGFVSGRYMDDILVSLHLLLHAALNKQLQGQVWVLSLDQHKAFDWVRREWLLNCLASYGVGLQSLLFTQEMYCHPSVLQTIKGHLTDPILLKCGLPQGNLLLSVLYNISLQPLLGYAHKHHIGVTLKWDPSHPVSSMAFVNDVLLVFSSKVELDQFLDVLDLYKMASNGKVNKDKSCAL